jgi:hypothetical protein
MRIETTCSVSTKRRHVLVEAGFYPCELHYTISKSFLTPPPPPGQQMFVDHIPALYWIVREVRIRGSSGLHWGSECAAVKTFLLTGCPVLRVE